MGNSRSRDHSFLPHLNHKDDSKDIQTIDPDSHDSALLELTDISSLEFIIIQGEKNTDDILDYLSSINDKIFAEQNAYIHHQDLLLYKFKCTNEISLENRQKLNYVLKNESAVLLFECQSEEKITIYWKLKEIDEFLQLKHSKKLNFDEAQKLLDFIADFLARSLKANHLGIIKQLTFKQGLKPLELEFIADSREFNLLFLAVEKGNLEMVEILLKVDINTMSQDNKFNAQTIAMNCQHFDVLLMMLEKNLKFPISFDASKCTGKLKNFCEIIEKVHTFIQSNEKEMLAKILNEHEKLRHFYNFENESALKVAIKSRSFEVFDFLLSKKFRFGSHENPAEYYEELDIPSKRRVRDIQNKYSQPFPDRHIHILTSKSLACYDEAEADDKLSYVQGAFSILNKNALIRIILMVVAASKNFKIVFDFNREAVNILDPTTNEFTQGIFYLSGKIFIGAKQLLNPETMNETLAVLAHELCHFAMNIVYKNHAKPYRHHDKKAMDAFEKVLKDCEAKSEEEEIIDSVFRCYPEEAHHAELIVRVVHILALYKDLPDAIAEVQDIFIKLFEYYEKKVVPELEQALPELEGSDEEELIKKDKKIFKLKKILIFGGILSVVGILGAIFIAFLLYTPTYEFDKLSDGDKKLMLKAPIKYKNINIKLGDLFPANSTVLRNLTSNHIYQIMKGNVLDFDDFHLAYLNSQVTHNWATLTENLKNKFLNSNFIFQNEIIKFKELHEQNVGVFNYLNSQQIFEVLDGKVLFVHKINRTEKTFYFERSYCFYFYCSIRFDFNKVIDLANELKLFILSGEAGTGKTNTFEQITIEIKKIFPTKWVSYIDLKDHKELYRKIETLNDVNEMLKKILKLSSKNEFEMRIFEEFFDSGNLILLWNGFDEISPGYSRDVVYILSLIRKNTQNIQFICTRPLYSDLLKMNSYDEDYGLAPFDKDEQEQFIKSFLLSLDAAISNLPLYIQKIKRIIKVTESEDDFGTPLMLGMIAELVKNDIEIYESENIYEIYRKFIIKKIEIWQNKNDFGSNFALKVISIYGGFNMMKLYQSYALKSEIKIKSFEYFYLPKLNIMQQIIPDELTNDELSRMGILYINDPKTFKFAHRTFAEFFIAQYFIENIYNPNDFITDEEAEMRSLFLMNLLTNRKSYSSILRFVDSFLKTKSLKFVPKIANLLKTKFKIIFIEAIRFGSIKNFNVLYSHIKENHEVLKSLFYIDEDRTLYTRLMSTCGLFDVTFDIETNNFMRSFAKTYLSQIEYNYFINGKYQKGVAQFGSYCSYFGKDENWKLHEIYDKLDDKLLENNDLSYVFESIVKNLTKNEFKVLLESGGIFRTYKIFNVNNFNARVWSLIKITFQKVEQKEIVRNIIQNIDDPEIGFICTAFESFLKFLELNIGNIFTENEIFELFLKYEILFKLASEKTIRLYDFSCLNSTWNFIAKHTNQEQQRMLLKQKIKCTKKYYYFCSSSSDIVLLIAKPFPFLMRIYNSLFSKPEIQEIILSLSNDFLMIFITNRDLTLESLVRCLREAFVGNKNRLKEFILQKIEPTNKNIFELSKSFNDIKIEFFIDIIDDYNDDLF